MSSGSKVDQSSSSGRIARLTPSSIVYWSRFGFAILAGSVYTVLGLGLQGVEVGTLGALGLGVLFYIASVCFFKYVLGYGEAQLKGPRKIVTTGMGTYIIWLIFSIILLNTILFGH